MKLVRFTEEHYPMLCEWWKEYGHGQIALESLSPVGLVCYLDDKPICLSFVYLAVGSDLGWVCWTTGDPKADKDDRKTAIEFCLEGLFELSKSYGRNHVVCYSESKNVTEIFKNAGFTVGSPHDMLYGKVGS